MEVGGGGGQRNRKRARFRQLEGRIGGGRSSSNDRKPTTSEKELNAPFRGLWGVVAVVAASWGSSWAFSLFRHEGISRRKGGNDARGRARVFPPHVESTT